MSGCNSGIKLFENGVRLFLTTEERHKFRCAVGTLDTPQRLFCRLLYYTGCKISEAINLHPYQINGANQTILLEKAGDRLTTRHVPVPPALIMELSVYFPPHEINVNRPLWSMSRSTGWRIVNEAMGLAGIHGRHATSQGLRHSFAISCLELWPKISLSQIQQWLGHSSVELTLSYYKAFDQNVENDNLEFLWSYI